jgi:hypothetical protein
MVEMMVATTEKFSFSSRGEDKEGLMAVVTSLSPLSRKIGVDDDDGIPDVVGVTDDRRGVVDVITIPLD